MLQIEIFELSENGASKANKFIKSKRLIENGVQVRDNVICVLHDEADSFDEKSREVALIQKLSQVESALLASEIEKEYYELVEAGEKMTPESLQGKQKNLETISGLHAQIFIIKKKLGRDPGEPTLFGKKRYHKKD